MPGASGGDVDSKPCPVSLVCDICLWRCNARIIYFIGNLALERPAWQAYNFTGKSIEWGASKAVDGFYAKRGANGNKCTISGNEQRTATWWVNLQSVVSISYVKIYYRTDNLQSPSVYVSRFAGFFLYVSNTTAKEDGHLCFHEIQNISGTPIEDQRINCSVYGQYVIYYNERKAGVTYPNYYSNYAYNELCELEVYGCPDSRYYGKYCDKLCPNSCLGQRCNISTGNCLACTPGYKGPRCSQECDVGKYGLKCKRLCGYCRDGTSCHHIEGTCLQGCSPGYMGSLCDSECDIGMYGANCSHTCGHCLNDTQCHHVNGTCLQGCSTGYKGFPCTEECGLGRYGYKCYGTCGHCINDTNCDHVNGSCVQGCSSGYVGLLCNTQCEMRKWGINCRNNCSTDCVNQKCYHHSGDCITNKPLELQEERPSALAIAGGVIAAIFVLLIIVVSIILRRRTQTLKASNADKRTMSAETNLSDINTPSKTVNEGLRNIYENMEGTSYFKEKKDSNVISNKHSKEPKTRNNERDDDIDNDEKLHDENPYGDFYINEKTIPDINIEDLESTIKEKRKNEDDGFKREYAAMPYGEKYPCDAGKQPENVPKNRFKTTFPYDHSRVKLSNSQSDYINANFIEGTKKPDEYIAAQGPRQNTLTDFWSMIWQENVAQIVMLTNLKEGNKIKCTKYWSDLNQSNAFGLISLCTEEEQSYASYKIRKFRVTYKGHQLKKSRLVTQYHYTAWPDHGTPEPLCLVVFHDQVTRTKDNQNGGPTLVHCSAGIGRTGTYIAIDALYKEGKTERKVNIAEYVKKMRENRMNMVQTYEQYITIFLALDAMFKSPTCVQTKLEFLRKAELMTRDKPANESELRKEFQNLLRVRPSYTEADYKLALQSGESISSVLPLDKYSLFLSSNIPKRRNYINAVSLPSYTKNNGFIITHYPSPEDAVDFLRLLTDHASETVICMDPLREVESTQKWLPSTNNSKALSFFTVHCEQEKVTEMKCTIINIIQNGENNESCLVSVIEPKENFQTTDRSQVTAQMLRLVSFVLQSETEGPITIVSSDGAALCGVFCAVYNVIQQLSMDGEVDIFSTVRMLQIHRPELCSTVEEYRMVYDVVLDYIRAQEDSSEENIYCNQ
ncbi:receptor-type tyrosine-protein phosphatase epsilon-like [Saccostrea echinata]|uniref:receptor-type tyrosine-protein phosphatase epsilon-like n=1 Tax=Saccostrea echinata TaxID=191078 RepID=UPI002A820876|nr:receptor-type tyrosine-protein phosphatase epsilon-like [Saccostrea echinata]